MIEYICFTVIPFYILENSSFSDSYHISNNVIYTKFGEFLFVLRNPNYSVTLIKNKIVNIGELPFMYRPSVPHTITNIMIDSYSDFKVYKYTVEATGLVTVECNKDTTYITPFVIPVLLRKYTY